MSCRQLVEVVTDYLDGALSSRDQARFERHIHACEGCQAHLEQVRRTIRLVGKLTEADLSPEARDVLLEAFRSWRSA